jgi:hypothetical protein
VCALADLTPGEARHVLVLLHEWDLAATGRHSITELFAALQLLTLVRLPPGALSARAAGAAADGGGAACTHQASRLLLCQEQQRAPEARESVRGSLLDPQHHAQRGSAGAATASSQSLQAAQQRPPPPPQQQQQAATAAAGHGPTLREVHLKERVAALEAQLAHAQQARVATQQGSVGDSREVRV